MNLKPYACSHAGCEMRFAYKAVRDKHEQCSMHAEPVLVSSLDFVSPTSVVILLFFLHLCGDMT